mgnify:CR=1 FL=1
MSLIRVSGSWLSFRDYEGKVLLYFTNLRSDRPAIKEVLYSLNSEALDQTFKFKSTDKMFDVGHEYVASGMTAYIKKEKEPEFAARGRGYTIVSHQQEVGTG